MMWDQDYYKYIFMPTEEKHCMRSELNLSNCVARQIHKSKINIVLQSKN